MQFQTLRLRPRSPCAARSPFAVRRSPFAVRRSPFAVRRSPFAVRRHVTARTARDSPAATRRARARNCAAASLPSRIRTEWRSA
ncbi:hypothetical protein F7R23_17870 [Burkholderia diffusa]|nr:hypothetical protein F7R23_17870 [Burkholderia diffusa]